MGITTSQLALTFICTADKIFNKAANILHFLLSSGLCGLGDICFSRLKAFDFLVDVFL